MTIHVSETKRDHSSVLKVDGHLKADDVSELTRAYRLAHGNSVLDLSELQSADSAGLETLRELVSLGAEIRHASPLYRIVIENQTLRFHRDHSSSLSEGKARQRVSIMRITFVLITLLFASGTQLCPAQGIAPPAVADARAANQPQRPSPDVIAIRAASELFVAAFNKQDAKAVAALWMEDGEYIDDTGRVLVGRAEIEKDYQEFFVANPDAKIQITIDSVRSISRHSESPSPSVTTKRTSSKRGSTT